LCNIQYSCQLLRYTILIKLSSFLIAHHLKVIEIEDKKDYNTYRKMFQRRILSAVGFKSYSQSFSRRLYTSTAATTAEATTATTVKSPFKLQQPSLVALRDVDEPQGVTYAQLEQRAAALAAELKTNIFVSFNAKNMIKVTSKYQNILNIYYLHLVFF